MAELCERLLLVQERWRSERDTAAAELEPVARRLRDREQTLEARAQALEPLEAELRRRQDELARLRLRLEGGQARLTAAEAAWQGERDASLARMRAREQRLERQRASLHTLRQRWTERRRREIEQLRAERTWCEALRRESALLREEWFRRSEVLEQGRRALAEQALALEQYRLECVSQAEDSVAAEKRIESLRRSWATLHGAAERTLARERRALEAETARLEERARRLELQAAEGTRRETELTDRQTAWEQEGAQAEAAHAELRQELYSLRAVAALHEQQMDKLRQEVERMARLLMDDDAPAAPTSRAA